MLFSWVDYKPADYNGIPYPMWADSLGWLMTLAVVVSIFATMIGMVFWSSGHPVSIQIKIRSLCICFYYLLLLLLHVDIWPHEGLRKIYYEISFFTNENGLKSRRKPTPLYQWLCTFVYIKVCMHVGLHNYKYISLCVCMFRKGLIYYLDNLIEIQRYYLINVF